jgi:hypothetical protein
MSRTLWSSLLAMALLLAVPASAKPHLFDDDAVPLKIVIVAPFPALVRDDTKTGLEHYPAIFTVTDGDDPAVTLPIQVSARGLSRRVAGYCTFPPILLTFDRAAAKGTLFKGQKKLKLVTYCRTPPDYEQRIRLEYLAYRLYNLITPVSLRVRAAEVTYRTGADDAGLTRFGYLIENINDVADRNERDMLSGATHQVSARQLDPHAAAQAAIFEFMISNLDWEFLAAPAGAECCHNIRLLAAHDAQPATATAVVPVPYDFDFSGFVDSPYASPPAAIDDLDSVTQRYYRGYCVSIGEIASVVEEYRSDRDKMLALVTGDPVLTPAFKNKAARFLGDFFALLSDPNRVQREITGHCR